MPRESGGCRNGKLAMSPSPSEIICRMTAARLVRRISGSVYSRRLAKSSSEYSRMAMPSLVRPLRPDRWLALAWLIASIGSRCTFDRTLYRLMRAVPASITYLIPGTVRLVSATLVASTIRRRMPAGRFVSNTRCCSAELRRP